MSDGISKEECSLQYTRIGEVAAKCIQLGAGILMGKMDIQEAYRNVPDAPEDKVYINKVLPIGLRSAPSIFSAVANTLQWIMTWHGS